MDKKQRQEMLKGWAESPAFPLFLEDINIFLNRNRDALANLDLFEEKDRAKGLKMQANVNCIKDICALIESYARETRVVGNLDIDNL